MKNIVLLTLVASLVLVLTGCNQTPVDPVVRTVITTNTITKAGIHFTTKIKTASVTNTAPAFAELKKEAEAAAKPSFLYRLFRDVLVVLNLTLLALLITFAARHKTLAVADAKSLETAIAPAIAKVEAEVKAEAPAVKNWISKLWQRFINLIEPKRVATTAPATTTTPVPKATVVVPAVTTTITK